jgi:hypothetical protein
MHLKKQLEYARRMYSIMNGSGILFFYVKSRVRAIECVK